MQSVRCADELPRSASVTRTESRAFPGATWARTAALALLAACLVGCVALPEDHKGARAPRFGGEVQVYPAGVIPAAHFQVPLSERDVLTLRAGYNFTERQDYGEHDDESGGGPGTGVGYRHYFGEETSGWLLGARVDLFSLEIDWKDDASATQPRRKGETDILVLQPTVEGGYRFALDDAISLDLTLGVGAEINVDTDGEDVGEGGIMLLGATIVFGG